MIVIINSKEKNVSDKIELDPKHFTNVYNFRYTLDFDFKLKPEQ